LNPVLPIGRAACNNPFYGSQAPPYDVPLVGVDDTGRTWFGNHEYSKQRGRNYDACMRAIASARDRRAAAALRRRAARLGHTAQAQKLLLRAWQLEGWLVDLPQARYDAITNDVSTPAERAADGGVPAPLPFAIVR
jgi:hypothetical protein